MSKTIVQKVVFKNTTPKALYQLYMDEKKHSFISGGPAKIKHYWNPWKQHLAGKPITRPEM